VADVGYGVSSSLDLAVFEEGTHANVMFFSGPKEDATYCCG